MPRNRTDRAVVKALKAKNTEQLTALDGVECTLKAMESTADELQTNKRMAEVLRDTSEDDRVRFNATKLIHDTALKIAELRFKIEEYKNPAEKKVNLNGSLTIRKTEIEMPKKLPVGASLV